MTPWRNRITGTGQEAPGQLLANPRNWRIHPKAQQDALAGALDQVGWVQQVVVNNRTGHLVDGHLRAQLAISRNEAAIPVVYVDLSEEEEALVLASLDPLAGMAGTDQAKLDELLAEISFDSKALGEALGALAGSFDIAALLDPEHLPSGDRNGYRQMAFIVSDEQAETVSDALRRAIDMAPFDSDNQNRNGNALARIAETFIGIG